MELEKGARAVKEDRADTRAQILAVASTLLRSVGYNAFSYADIATEVGISKASIHHHFASKSDLGRALIVDTKTLMEQELAKIENSPSAALLRYFEFFEVSVTGRKTCLCGMLLAESDGLPSDLQTANNDFVGWQLKWLEQVLEKARMVGELRFDGVALEEAEFIYGAVQGTHIVAKSRNDVRIFNRSMKALMDRYCAR